MGTEMTKVSDSIAKLAKIPLYKEYVRKKRDKGEKPLQKDDWETKVLGKPGEDSKKGKPGEDSKKEAPHNTEHEDSHEHGKEHEGKPKAPATKPTAPATKPKQQAQSLKDMVGGFFSKAKGIKDDIVKGIKEAPESVQKFVADPEYRKETLKKTSSALRKHKDKIIKHVKHEAKEWKEEHIKGLKGFGKLVTGKKIDKHDAHAMFHTGLTIAAVSLAGATGGALAAASVLGKTLGRHIASKAIHDLVKNLDTAVEGATVTYEMGEKAHHLLEFLTEHGHHLMGSARYAGEDKEDGKKSMSDDEALEAFTQLITEKLADLMDKGVSDDELRKMMKDEPEGSPFEGDKKSHVLLRIAMELEAIGNPTHNR